MIFSCLIVFWPHLLELPWTYNKSEAHYKLKTLDDLQTPQTTVSYEIFRIIITPSTVQNTLVKYFAWKY